MESNHRLPSVSILQREIGGERFARRGRAPSFLERELGCGRAGAEPPDSCSRRRHTPYMEELVDAVCSTPRTQSFASAASCQRGNFVAAFDVPVSSLEL